MYVTFSPHFFALAAGHAGAIIDQIAAHSEITALQQHILDQANAVEFLEVYKGVVPEYNVSACCVILKLGPMIRRSLSFFREIFDLSDASICGPAPVVDQPLAHTLSEWELDVGVSKGFGAKHGMSVLRSFE